MQITHPLTLPLKSTQNVAYFIITHQCQPVSTVRGTFYIFSVSGSRYILTFMWLVSLLPLLLLSNCFLSSSKNSVCQALTPRSDSSHSYSYLFMILLHFVMIGQPRDFVDKFFFKIFHHFLFSTFLLLFGCLLFYLSSNFFITFMIHNFLMCDHSEETDFYLRFC